MTVFSVAKLNRKNDFAIIEKGKKLMEKDNCRIFSFFLGTIKKKALSLQRKKHAGAAWF